MAADTADLVTTTAAPMTGARFIVLLMAALSVSMAYGVTLPVLPFVVERLVGTDQAAISRHTGTLTGVYTVALFVFSPIWGALSDRIGRRTIIAAGLAGSCISLLLLDFAGTLGMLYAARAASGVLSAAVLPCVLAYVAETSAPSQRPRAFASISSATTLGFLVGPVAGSWLSSMVLAPIEGMRIAGWLMADSPFFAVAMVNLLSAAALAALPAMRTGASPNPAAAGDVKGAVDRPRIYRGLVLTCMTVFCITVAEVGITLLGKQVLSLRPEGIARFFLLCSGVMIVVQICIFPICMRKLALPILILASFALSALGLALIGYAIASGSIMLAFALVSAGTALAIPALATLISGAAGPLQGKVMGQQASSANLGQALAASLTGMLFLAMPAAPFLAGAAVAAIGMLGSFQKTENKAR